MLLALLGCVDPELLEEAPGLTPLAWEALAAPRGEALAGRARIERPGSLRFTDAGPVVNNGGDSAYVSELTAHVVEEGDGLRIATEQRGVRLLVWTDRSDYHPVLARSVWLDSRGREARSGAAGVQVLAGTVPESDDAGEFVSLEGALAGRVPVAETVLDEWYRPEPLSALAKPDAIIPAGFAIHADDGSLLATVTEDGWWVAELERKGDWVLVEGDAGGGCRRSPMNVRGWVEAAAMDSEPPFPSAFGFGCCGGFGGGWGWGWLGERKELPADALLYDAPDGDIVGLTTAEVNLPIDAEAGDMPGWTAVLVHTQWGSVTTWAAENGRSFGELPAPDVREFEFALADDPEEPE